MKDDGLSLSKALQQAQSVEEKREILLKKYRQTL
jgi:hypothetical protein